MRARRSSSDRPPHTPESWPDSRAYCRQISVTVQVAQANLSTGFWDSVKSFFTGGERKEDGVVESLAENERSIFWGN